MARQTTWGYMQSRIVPHLHDIHATILHLLGLNHEELTYTHSGREERMTITEGQVIEKILA